MFEVNAAMTDEDDEGEVLISGKKTKQQAQVGSTQKQRGATKQQSSAQVSSKGGKGQ